MFQCWVICLISGKTQVGYPAEEGASCLWTQMGKKEREILSGCEFPLRPWIGHLESQFHICVTKSNKSNLFFFFYFHLVGLCSGLTSLSFTVFKFTESSASLSISAFEGLSHQGLLAVFLTHIRISKGSTDLTVFIGDYIHLLKNPTRMVQKCGLLFNCLVSVLLLLLPQSNIFQKYN